ncbi:MAG: DUF3524 domain-containing protein [Phycisphaerae bacterium]|nr:DUF3524 domain-containing protein [Phycisphaerae bacterium]
MSGQLDILALEPFYGGVRRVMLDTLIRGSKHRWTLLKLPPRRIERRLTAAAHWFAEHLTRHWVGHVDLLFTSEALNLSDLNRLVPTLSHVPSVVYFHSNQLPPTDAMGQSPLDLINLNSAAAANEIWFNSKFHLAQFMARATSLVSRHPELATRNPLPDLRAKTKIFPPPIDLTAVHAAMSQNGNTRDSHNILIDLREVDVEFLNEALGILTRRGENFQLLTIGEVRGLSEEFPRLNIDDGHDESRQAAAMAISGVYVSAHQNMFADYQAIRAVAAGCWPVVPDDGCYAEMLPVSIHDTCMYEWSPDALADRIQDVFYRETDPESETDVQSQVQALLKNFSPGAACRVIDERLAELASTSHAASVR